MRTRRALDGGLFIGEFCARGFRRFDAVDDLPQLLRPLET